MYTINTELHLCNAHQTVSASDAPRSTSAVTLGNSSCIVIKLLTDAVTGTAYSTINHFTLSSLGLLSTVNSILVVIS